MTESCQRTSLSKESAGADDCSFASLGSEPESASRPVPAIVSTRNRGTRAKCPHRVSRPMHTEHTQPVQSFAISNRPAAYSRGPAHRRRRSASLAGVQEERTREGLGLISHRARPDNRIERHTGGFSPQPSPGAVVECDRMIRLGLSLYLMLVMSAGPSFCCCSLTRLARWLLTPPQQKPLSPTADAHSCCRPQRAPDSKREKPARPSCPCREDGSKPAALSALESDVARNVERSPLDPSVPTLDFASLVVFATPPAGSIRGPCQSAACHFSIAQDMLRAHHVLRC